GGRVGPGRGAGRQWRAKGRQGGCLAAQAGCLIATDQRGLRPRWSILNPAIEWFRHMAKPDDKPTSFREWRDKLIPPEERLRVERFARRLQAEFLCEPDPDPDGPAPPNP